MWKDPIVEEVRKIRQEHAAKFNYDLKAICEDIRRYAGKEINPPYADREKSASRPRSGKLKPERDAILSPRST